MKRLWVALLAFLAAGNAYASDPIPGSLATIGNWTLEAYTGKSGAFSICALSGDYHNGNSLFFLIGHDFRWSIMLKSANLKLQAEQKVDISLYVDDFGPYRAVATAIRRDTADAFLPDSLALFDLMRKGNRLTVLVQSDRYDFSLEGTYAALSEAHRCVKHYAAILPRKAPLPSDGSPAPKAEPAKPSAEQALAERRLEATTFAANLLAQGDFSEFRILSGKERLDPAVAPYASWDVVWIGDDVLGALRVEPSAVSAAQISTSVLSRDARACSSGQFASGTSVDDKDDRLSRLFTSCRDGKKETTARYVIIPRPEKGFYLLGTFSNAEGKPAEGKVDDIDGLLRASVFNVSKKK